MTRADLFLSDSFAAKVDELESDILLAKVEKATLLLAEFPDMGSTLLREGIASRYGNGARKVVVGPYLIVYAYDGDEVHVLDLVPGNVVR